MKNICMIFLLLSLSLFADITMKKAKKEKPEIVLPIEKPIRPIHPIRPIINTGIVYQDNYYNEHYTYNCQHYIDILAEKDKEILTLRSKLAKFQNKEQQKLSKSLKKSYDEELEVFENRKNSINRKNSVTISNEPVH